LTLLNDHLLSKCCLTRAQQCTLISEGYAQTCKSWEDKMNIAEFKASITEKAPPANLPVPLAALWWDAKGDWAEAHAQVDELETVDGMAVHASIAKKAPRPTPITGTNAPAAFFSAQRSTPSGPRLSRACSRKLQMDEEPLITC
jgi:hypothetical protein